MKIFSADLLFVWLADEVAPLLYIKCSGICFPFHSFTSFILIRRTLVNSNAEVIGVDLLASLRLHFVCAEKDHWALTLSLF
mmetsp:Transcript_11006/g.21801  ORF Transcript_11006/g.21801 Transcript_11006/m.21801 type:complete len:81 (-) Transcript_11006:2334-2576(-)